MSTIKQAVSWLTIFTAALALSAPAGAADATAEEFDVVVPSGERAPLGARLTLPEGPGPFATLIIAPGGGYDMDQPLTGGLAKQAAKAGFASVRFNWRYYGGDDTGPSESLTIETADLKHIVAWAKDDDRLDRRRLFLAGKSLGSVVTYRVASADKTIRATYLLTPICRQLGESGQNAIYRELLQSSRPVVLVLGNRDPLCPLPNLYKWLGPANENIVTLIFGGDHGMRISSDADGLSAQNEQQAIEAVVHWVSIHDRDPGSPE